ncbi:uncharacterized protein LOC132613812 [Lycium barbarum]|uniref:uncharacterized protein LOC132613812 n=1 Tax=Lycium barbarum TaxID=112863 RepID=UPI00293E2728|nr:uncharacterized protein LOC132613812 [Lycium barbarum]
MTILNRIFSNKPGAFFIDGPGGTGKTFLYRALLATVRLKGFIAIATTTSGVAASVLPGGRTAHSCFKLPIDVGENYCCNISKQSSLAFLIQDAKLIVWDEVSMARKKLVETFDSLFRDVMGINTLFGGKVVVFGGDFRQTLPVVKSGAKKDFIRECLLYSNIWDHLQKFRLTQNMRACKDPAFCEYLLRIGHGREEVNEHDKIEVPKSFLIPFTNEKESLDILFKTVYPNLEMLMSDTSSVTSRVILTTKNDFVNEINQMFIDKFPTTAVTFIGIDETVEPKDQSQFEDFLHSLNPTGLPPYNAKIASGDFKGKHVFIPRIPLLCSPDEKLPIQFQRTQFPVRLCFAMTINKAQGQTLDSVGIYLREPVFSHDQLDVALSRAKSSDCDYKSVGYLPQKEPDKYQDKNKKTIC